MTLTTLTPEYHRMAVGARVLAMLILGIPTVVYGDSASLVTLAVLGAMWTLSTITEQLNWVNLLMVLLESAVVGGLAAISLGSGLMLLPALAVPPFTAGLRRGVRGMALALSVEVVVLLLVSLRLYGGLAADEASNTLTAVLTGIGLGLIASHVHSQLRRPPDPLTPYRDAQRLLRDLIDLSGTLGSGLDATALGSRIAVTVRDQLPLLAVTVFVPRQDELEFVA